MKATQPFMCPKRKQRRDKNRTKVHSCSCALEGNKEKITQDNFSEFEKKRRNEYGKTACIPLKEETSSLACWEKST